MSKNIFVCLKEIKDKNLFEKFKFLVQFMYHNNLKQGNLFSDNDEVVIIDNSDNLVEKLFAMFIEILELNTTVDKLLRYNLIKDFIISDMEFITKIDKDIYKLNFEMPYVFICVKKNKNFKHNRFKDMV